MLAAEKFERGQVLPTHAGVITLTQPKVPEAKIRGSQKGFQWVMLGLEMVSGVLKGVQRSSKGSHGTLGPPGPLELSALRPMATQLQAHHTNACGLFMNRQI
jgi:hypothetical protein